MPKAATELEQAVQAAKRGKRVRARELFLDIVDQDPCNLTAWIWLSRLINDPRDQMTALENALQLAEKESSQQRVLQTRLEEAQSAYPELVARLVKPDVRAGLDLQCNKARDLLRGNLRAEALDLAQSIVEADPTHEQAWLLLSEFHPDIYQQIEALKNALLVNFHNKAAWARLKALNKAQKSPLQTGLWLEERGQFEQAVEIYRSAITHSRSSMERWQAQRSIDRITLQQESEHIRPVAADLNLVRLAAGPILLFAMMVFFQSGLNPLHISPLACPGILSVLLGSLMLSATGMRPLHPLWIGLFGVPGTPGEPKMRRELRMLAWVLMLAPFTMFLIAASYRLGVLQASMFTR